MRKLVQLPQLRQLPVITFERARFRVGWPPLGYHISGSSVRVLRSLSDDLSPSSVQPSSSSHSRTPFSRPCGLRRADPRRARGVTSASTILPATAADIATSRSVTTAIRAHGENPRICLFLPP
ncbi:hypothetical protein DBV15_08692, partial [Temnothorax longispinosus]